MELSQRLEEIYRAAVAACDAGELTRAALERERDLRATLSGARRMFLLACGKAALAQARSLAECLGERLVMGLVVVPAPKRPARAPPRTAIVCGGHPLPNAGSVAAAERAMELVRSAGKGDLVLCAVSGGASALMAMPAPGLTLDDKIETTSALLTSGADIQAINTVRKHLSAIKGGQLAAATPARVVTLLLSDVLGDAPDVVGSGPSLPDPTTFAEALSIIDRYELRPRLARTVLARLEAGARGELPETSKPTPSLCRRLTSTLIAGPEDLLAAACREAQRHGFAIAIRGLGHPGESVDDVANEIADAAQTLRARAGRSARPRMAVWVREPTVRLRVQGHGGRNQHLALLVARVIAGQEKIAFLAAGSDGIDGVTAAAGAVVDGTTWASSVAAGVRPDVRLATSDSGTWATQAGAAIVTGPSGTNLLDLHLLAAI